MLPLTLNLYMYCGGDPINYTDPTGHGFLKRLYKKLVKAATKSSSRKASRKTTKKSTHRASATVRRKAVVKRVSSAAKKVKKKTKNNKKKNKKTFGKNKKTITAKIKVSTKGIKLTGEAVNVLSLANVTKDVSESIYDNVKGRSSFSKTANEASTELLFGVTSVAVGLYTTLGVTALATVAFGPVGWATAFGITAGIIAGAAFNNYVNNKKIKRKWNQIGQ